MRAIPTAIATALLAAALVPVPAPAGSVLKTLTQDAGNACTLSIPTTDTGVRPKASGFRNEGSKNAFVICSVDVDSTGDDAASTTDTRSIRLNLASFDGASHATNCTAVARYPDTLDFIQYFTIPPITTAASGIATSLSTQGAPASLFDHQRGVLSVTCILPPGVSILSVQRGHYDVDSNDPAAAQCSDGMDNDGDGFADYPSDPGCTAPDDNDEFDVPFSTQCSDGMDNDGDGLTDFPADLECTSASDDDEAIP